MTGTSPTTRRPPCTRNIHNRAATTATAFTPISKRRRGFPSEQKVKKGSRGVQTPAGFKDFCEKLGRNDLCPCGSGALF
ncbi:MAG: SEC-C domain-containing protein [Phycisphaeraceae bacterium]|nr:SEC-C domain-containing protein [Phycisphaeraceae bacterium]